MATPKSRPQTIAFIPPGVEQSVGTRSLPLGRLVEATNVRQIKKGEWRKRPGFARAVPSVDTFAYGNADPGQSVYAGALVERDLAGQFWSYDSVNNVRRYRGIVGNGAGGRPFPSYQDAGINLAPTTITSGGSLEHEGTRCALVALGASNDRWVFAVGEDKFQFTIFRSDGSVKLAATTQTSTDVSQLAAVYDPLNGFMWVIALNGNPAGLASAATSYKFSSDGVFQSSATYASFTGGTGIDAKWLTSHGEMAVVISQYDTGTPRCRVTHSYLNPSTGQPRGSPAAVNVDVTPHANRSNTCGGVRILVSSGATSWYYSFWRASSTSNTMELILVQVTSVTLTAAATSQLATSATTAASEWRAVTSGYLDTVTGNRVVFSQIFNPNTVTTRTFEQDTRRYTWNGSVSTQVLVAQGAWLASDPALIGTTWYFLTGRDDGLNYLLGGVAVHEGHLIRRGELYLRDSSGNIVAQLFDRGDGPPFWHRAFSIDNEVAGVFLTNLSQFVTNLLATSATGLILATGRVSDVFYNPKPTVVTLDFAASYGPPAAIRSLAVFPGPIVTACGPSDRVGELFPLHAPPFPRVALGSAGATGTASACITYRIPRSDGTFWESSPSPSATGTYFATDNSIVAPTVRHSLGAAIQICLYSSALGSSILTLQDFKPNDPAAATVTFKVWPYQTSFVAPTALYTNGGGLSNTVIPPARAVALWRDRLHLSGTPTEGEVWSSQEIVEGFPPTFSELLRSNWNDGQGAILGLKPVDHNYLAAFKRNGVAVASGPGPDGRGGNPYTWQTLTTEKGLSDAALASPVSTPWGCEFQNEADGRWCVAGTDLQVKDIMQGADSHASKTVACALLNEAERQVWVYCTDGTLLVRGYAFADQERPLGDWWRWESDGLLRAYGAVMTPTGPMHIESNGVIRSPGAALWRDITSGSPVDIEWAIESGRLAPFGLFGEGAVVGAHILGEAADLGFGDVGMTVTVTPDDAILGSSHIIFPDPDVPVDFSMKPAGCFRCKEVRVRVEESSINNVEGVVFVGVALDVVPYGRTRILPVGQRIG